jgi:hypothetical protein
MFFNRMYSVQKRSVERNVDTWLSDCSLFKILYVRSNHMK